MRARTILVGLVLLTIATIAVPVGDIMPVGEAVATTCEPTISGEDVECVAQRVRCLRWCL